MARPKGSKGNKQVIRDQIAAMHGKTPLQVMLAAMEYFLGLADKAGEDDKARAAAMNQASEHASDAAPYVHSKMPQGVQVQGNITLTVNDKRDMNL